MDRADNARATAWRLFDELVARAGRSNPWAAVEGEVVFEVDEPLLCRLLAVPVLLGATTTTGVPALALDVWVAHELRRAGLAPDEVWPRATPPRVQSRDLSALLAALPSTSRQELLARLAGGRLSGVVSGQAKVLGKNYVKQVDVVMAAWDTGPQVLISTKRMDSALGKNAANRVEESYGDAKNLRSRYPRAALGFLYALAGSAVDKEPVRAEWLLDLLGKLGQEDDAYDCVALVVPDLPQTDREGSAASAEADADPSEDAWAALQVDTGAAEPEDPPVPLPETDVERMLADLPDVRLRSGPVPARLRPGRFFEVVVRKVLAETPVDFHREARRRLAQPG